MASFKGVVIGDDTTAPAAARSAGRTPPSGAAP